jgi:hypothetical protein
MLWWCCCCGLAGSRGRWLRGLWVPVRGELGSHAPWGHHRRQVPYENKTPLSKTRANMRGRGDWRVARAQLQRAMRARVAWRPSSQASASLASQGGSRRTQRMSMHVGEGTSQERMRPNSPSTKNAQPICDYACDPGSACQHSPACRQARRCKARAGGVAGADADHVSEFLCVLELAHAWPPGPPNTPHAC